MARSTSPASRTKKKTSPKTRTFTVFHTALKYLDNRVNVERSRPRHVDPKVFRLNRMKALLDALGNPHEDLKFVHVGGSKGKGSTVEMIASCLTECGYATGVYTSPHLVDVTERIRIDGQAVTPEEFPKLMSKVATAAESIARKHGEATYFEILTAMAFLHFAQEAVDIAVVEVGLGGRLDCTNLITPEVVAITEIQLEHTELLGDTITLIAGEKAGIFKEGVTAITVQQPKEALEVFKEKASEVGCDLRVLGRDVEFSFRFEADPDRGPHARVSLSSSRSEYEHLPVPLRGEHQAHNCGLALAVLDHLRERGFEAPERRVAIGLDKTPPNGRLELVWRSPKILVDGAHNPPSISALVKAIGSHIRYDSMVVIFGCASDKDIEGMLQGIALGADKIIFTKATDNPRAMDPHLLQKQFEALSPKMTQTAENVKDAINLAYKSVGRDDIICVTGSFYLAGEAKRLLTEAQDRREDKPARTKAKA